ncbi:MAG TPA: metalloregulator ArsR/SmtB family transcription factor, partial [Thermodesulfobacteriota bacterium]|nr:metalloregulator ArsR/SmtB family transcription factor [Thermodesulfobacteriota bacterium]
MGSPFKAISDDTRRDILELLSKSSATAGDISKNFDVSKPAISNHLRILKEANLVVERKVRQNRVYSINAEEIIKMKNYLEKLTGKG